MNHKNAWYKNALVYQVYPRSFKDSNGDGIGDLNGIIEKLDYLNGKEDSLGVDAIWLNPIYKSPQKDFGYDISNYRDIDPVFGDLKIFDRLVSEAHLRGIKIIMDFVPNHTSSEHPWFLESRSSRGNPKRDWYIWQDGKGDGPPNNWLSVFGGSAWEHDDKTGQYYLHTFLADQPDLNWRNKEVREEMLNVMKFWLARGVDGFRTDALYHLVKDDKFRDDLSNPNYVPGKNEPYNSLIHEYSAGRPELLDTANAMCAVMGESAGKFMVSESYLGIAEMAKLYKACDDKLHAPMNFNFIGMPWDAAAYKKIVDEFETSLSPNDVPNYVFGNHDRSRVASRLGQEKVRLAAMLLFTLRGMAFVYYGDELGMEDAQIPDEKCLDPWGKNVPDLGLSRDPERTPMQWNNSKYAGFSNVKPWLPFFDQPERRNVEAEAEDPHSTLSLYKRLIRLRRTSDALKDGKYRPIESKSPNVFAFAREHDKDRALIMLNFGEKEETAACEVKDAKTICNSLLNCGAGEETNLETFVLKPYEGYVFSY